MTPRERYNEAHKLYIQREFPNVWKDGHYFPPKMPDYTTHNGLRDFMKNYINFIGGYARTHNVVTRVSDVVTTEESGNKFTDKRYTKSSKRGIADVQATIQGRKIQLDAKVGSDRPSHDQIKEQALERKAGGIYEFIRTPEQFFDLIDSLLYG